MIFFESMWAILLSLAPWLLLGAAIAGVLHGLLPPTWIHRQFRGRAGVLKAVALGVPLPLCSCGVIPAGLGLKKEGASDGAAVGFLISTPQTGVDSILVSASFLGWPFALFKVAAAAVTGVVGGWLADSGPHQIGEVEAAPVETSHRKSFREIYDYTVDLLHMIWRWLAFGILVSAAIDTWVPAGAMAGIADWPPLLTGLVALAFSLPLYVCATASVPIAATLVSAGVPAGAALVFLMAGPATNVATIGAVYRGLGRRSLTVYLGTLIVGSLAMGWLFDFLVPVSTATAAVQHHVVKPWEPPAAILLVAVLIWFALRDLRRWWQGRVPSEADIVIPVSGMTCESCVMQVERAVQEVPGVNSATANLSAGEVAVAGNADTAAIRSAIESSGYRADAAS